MFKVVDGDRHWMDQVPAFQILYGRDFLVSEIKHQLDITEGEFRRLRRHCIKEGLINPRRGRPSNQKGAKYYSRSMSHGVEYYLVNKRVDGELYHFACFRKVYQAERMVELLKECGWDYSRRDELKEQVLREMR